MTLVHVILVVGAVALFLLSPLVTIWALNLLFATAIPFTLSTWFATVWITALLVTKVSK